MVQCQADILIVVVLVQEAWSRLQRQAAAVVCQELWVHAGCSAEAAAVHDRRQSG